MSALSITPSQIKELRKRINCTQEEFADIVNASLASVRNWEQGVRTPERPARLLLYILISQESEEDLKAWVEKIREASIEARTPQIINTTPTH